MGDQRPHHVGVREGDRALAEIFGDRPDDRHLPSAQLRPQDQRVQTVVLQLAPPDGQERVLEEAAHPLEVFGHAAQTEVVDPDRFDAVRRDLVRPLVHDLRPHVLERRQYVRERDPIAAEQLAAKHPVRRIRAAGTG